MAKRVTFTVNDRRVEGLDSQTVLAALVAQGFKVHAYCGVGHCGACLVTVDGESDIRSCLLRLRDGLSVQSAAGEGEHAN